ncbi:MAG: hypothetical protein KAJ19_13975 [Gammaproteobacteria bacterium]|nr:hypothetical protein [Gammaproteobacteria bacterium]
MAATTTFYAIAGIKKGDEVVYHQGFSTKKDLDAFMNAYGKANRGIDTDLSGFVYPIRTDSFKGFAEDLFFPPMVQNALKIENFIGKIFASFFAIALNILTFPIRLAASPLRFAYNQFNGEMQHPLHKYVKEGEDVKVVSKIIRTGASTEFPGNHALSVATDSVNLVWSAGGYKFKSCGGGHSGEAFPPAQLETKRNEAIAAGL